MASMNFSLARRQTSSVRTRVSVLGLALTVLANHGHPALAKQPAQMWMTVNAQRFAVTLEDSVTVRAFVQLVPLTLEMAELNGNEKHAKLPRSLPTAAKRVGSIRAGDVLLYGDDTLVVFYETFRSDYSYTRIGRIEETVDLTAALGSGSRRVTFTIP